MDRQKSLKKRQKQGKNDIDKKTTKRYKEKNEPPITAIRNAS